MENRDYKTDRFFVSALKQRFWRHTNAAPVFIQWAANGRRAAGLPLQQAKIVSVEHGRKFLPELLQLGQIQARLQYTGLMRL